MSQMSEDWQVTSVQKITTCTTSIAKVKSAPFKKYSTLHSRIRAINLVEKYIYDLKLLYDKKNVWEVFPYQLGTEA